MVQKFSPHSHIIIMEESSTYSTTRSTLSNKHLKSGYTYPAPFHINSGDHAGKGAGLHLGDMYQLPIKSEVNQLEVDGLFRNLKGFLIFGKIVMGLIPYSGLFESSSMNLSFKPKSPTAFVTYGIISILSINCVLGTIDSVRAPKRNALEIANSIRATLYFLWGFYIYITFIRRSQDFLKIFRAWEATRVIYTKKDLTLRRDVLLITVTILMSAILENGILHFEYFKEFDLVSGEKFGNSSNMTTLETYLSRSHPHWSKLLGYNWFLAVVAFIQHKWILYTWNYIDILISIMGRALYFRFKCLNQVAEEILLGSKDNWLENDFKETKAYRDPNAWLQVVQDHKSLCRLLDVLENFFSPLVFGSYFINLYYFCLQLLESLTSEVSRRSIVHSIYAPWSFIHIILRMFVVSICCARINVYAHKTRNLFNECPPECYSTELSRVDKRLNGGPELGLTGLQSFTVTKPFILSILSVVFTFEIVLLQCVPTDTPAPSTCCCTTRSPN